MKIILENRIPYAHIADIKTIDIEEGKPLIEILESMGVSQHLAIVNGVYVDQGYILNDYDSIMLLPVMSGG